MSPPARQKREEAQKEDRLGTNVRDSLRAWLWKWAIRGVQRWYWIENGRWGHLQGQPYMQIWGEPLTTNYCMYRVLLGRPETYPSAKPTGVWTNIRVNLKRCPCSGWHQSHPGVIGGAASRRVVLPSMDPYPSKRWTPQELQLDLHLATLCPEEQQVAQEAVRAAWGGL